MYTPLPILVLLPLASATIYGTCTPTPVSSFDLNKLHYPTTVTAVHTCTAHYTSLVAPFFDRYFYSDHEQTLTTIAAFPSAPNVFPYMHVVTVSGVLSRTEWVGGLYTSPGFELPPERKATWVSTVTDLETAVETAGV